MYDRGGLHECISCSQDAKRLRQRNRLLVWIDVCTCRNGTTSRFNRCRTLEPVIFRRCTLSIGQQPPRNQRLPILISTSPSIDCTADLRTEEEMSRQIYPQYPPDLSETQLQYLLTTIKDWSIAHGLAVRPPPSLVSHEQDPAGALAITAPVTLFPSLFPRACFEQGRAIQTAYNELYAAIASDEAWLKEIVEE